MGDEYTEARLRDVTQDLAFERRDHKVALDRARLFELALGTISAMLGPEHPATDVAQKALQAGLYPATQSSGKAGGA